MEKLLLIILLVAGTANAGGLTYDRAANQIQTRNGDLHLVVGFDNTCKTLYQVYVDYFGSESWANQDTRITLQVNDQQTFAPDYTWTYANAGDKSAGMFWYSLSLMARHPSAKTLRVSVNGYLYQFDISGINSLHVKADKLCRAALEASQ